MAGIGALYPMFAPFAGEEPEEKLPEYGEMIMLGGFIAGNITVSYAEGQLYADNVLAEEVRDFISGSIALETSYITPEAETALYGAKMNTETKELAHNKEDEPPLGGFGFVRTIQINNKVTQRGYFFPKVRAAVGSDTVQTKGSSITFGTPTTNLTIFHPMGGSWKYTKDFADEETARGWVEEKLGVETI